MMRASRSAPSTRRDSRVSSRENREKNQAPRKFFFERTPRRASTSARVSRRRALERRRESTLLHTKENPVEKRIHVKCDKIIRIREHILIKCSNRRLCQD